MYTTQPLVESYLNRDLSSKEAFMFTTVAGAVSRWIDLQTGTTWDPVEETRIFDGGEPILFIDPAVAVTKVEHIADDGTATEYDSLNFRYFPTNSKSITSIEAKGGRWPRGYDNIRVTAKWGEAGGVPDDIRLAATILAADWMDSSDKLKSESIEGYSRTFADTQDSNPQVDKILSARRRVRV